MTMRARIAALFAVTVAALAACGGEANETAVDDENLTEGGQALIGSYIERGAGQFRALVLTGEKASGEFLITQGRMVANNVEGVVVKGAGHWLIDEAPQQAIPKLAAFLTR